MHFRDLEIAVEELRSDVLNKRCRVNPSEIETMALALSNVSKALADLKGIFLNFVRARLYCSEIKATLKFLS